MIFFSENEKKEKQDDEDSQFFNLGSKALERLNSRKSIISNEIIVNKPQTKKVFKSPKAKNPLQILVSVI